MKLSMFALVGMLLLILTACTGGGGQNIVGKVLTYTGEAGAFLPVMVNGQKTSTDSSGNFSLSGVSLPYTLVVVQANKNQVYVYQGLSRLDPIVLVYGSGTNSHKSKVSYSFSNASTALPPAGESYDGQLVCASSTAQMSCGGTGSIGNAPYSDEVSWSGPTTVRVGFYALQTFKNSKNVVTSFNRFARSENEQLSDTQPDSVNLVFEPVTNKTLGGTITAPPGYTLIGRALGFRPFSRYVYPFSYELNQSGIASNFSWASPAIGGMDLYLTGTAKKGDASVYAYLDGVAPDNSSITLNLPAPSEQLQPAQNALGITNQTVFSWTPFSGAYSMSVYPTSSGPLAYIIYSNKTELTLPDLSSLGYPLPKGINYRWTVSSFGPVASINDLANGVPFVQYSQSGYSGERSFTTAP